MVDIDRRCLLITMCTALCVFTLSADDRVSAQKILSVGSHDVAAVLRDFSKNWPEDRTPYRTEEDTASWKNYAFAMKKLVAMGEHGVLGLLEGCNDASGQVRALSARVLGYLEAKAAVPKLTELLNDQNATVALLAADSLGQIHDARSLDALRSARRTEQRGDVLLHINKSLDRTNSLEDGVVEQILKIDRQTVDSAEPGKLAPEFTLGDADGEQWTLSDYRGKKSVVLVFIYGDG